MFTLKCKITIKNKNLSLHTSGLCESAIWGSEIHVATDYIIFIRSVYRQCSNGVFFLPQGILVVMTIFEEYI